MLTPTERVIAGQVAAGRTNREIAAELVLAEGTVKNHLSSLLRNWPPETGPHWPCRSAASDSEPGPSGSDRCR